MKIKSSLIGLLSLLTVAVTMPQPLAASCKNQEKNEGVFKHNIQLQLADFLGVPVENTEFWVTVEIVKKGNNVTVFLPTINFQVGQCALINPDCPLPPLGYIYTVDGFLPEEYRPGNLDPISIIAASNNGQTRTGFGIPIPTGYIVQVTNTGEIQIQQSGVFGNLLSTGSQIMMPCSISYTAKKKEVICKNFIIESGFTDVTQFTGAAANDNIRDSHVNDAYDNVAAWAWTDNHNIDPTIDLLNIFVAIGEVCENGRLDLAEPIQITNFPAHTIAWDTSIAINRKNTDNIVVSYLQINFLSHTQVNCRAVSFDRGRTWGGVYDGVTSLPFNGALNIQPASGTSGDYPGVLADKFGNFWICTTDRFDGSGNFINTPYLLISSDKGVTWNLAYEFPPPLVVNPDETADFYDYPHIAFGGDGSGHYGVWTYIDYIVAGTDIIPTIGFLPINGLGSFGTGEVTFLNPLVNAVNVPTIAASADGRFWAWGIPVNPPTLQTSPLSMFYKSPGDLASNYAGPWQNGDINQIENILGILPYTSIPVVGFFNSVTGLIYDEKRKALYSLVAAQAPNLSQNMRLYFAISRNNGQSWSRGYDISTTAFLNRGFSSMALDPISGNIFVGWYDGRNDPTGERLQYFGAVINSEMLDQLVRPIPFSDAVFSIPDQGSDTPTG